MRKRSIGLLLLGLIFAFSSILGSCDLNFTSYEIQVRLGHRNEQDPKKVTFTLSSLSPKTLEYEEWYPDAIGYHSYTVKLEKASDFMIVVETGDGSLQKRYIEIKDGYRYSIYYLDSPLENDIWVIETTQ